MNPGGHGEFARCCPVASGDVLKAFDGGRVFGAIHGSGSPAVLALHGWGRSSADFDVVLDGLDAIAVDLAGFGATPPPPEGWGAADYAASLGGVLAGMATPVVVLGHSFGGRVAVHLAASQPDQVAALVLTGVPLLRPPGAASGGRRPALGYRVGRALHRRGVLSDERMENLRQRFGSADYRAAQGIMRAVHVRAVNERYDAELAAIACPVELVWGDDDCEVPVAVAEEAVTRLVRADTELDVLPGAGHLTPITAPDALRRAIDRRLAARR